VDGASACPLEKREREAELQQHILGIDGKRVVGKSLRCPTLKETEGRVGGLKGVPWRDGQ